MSKGLGNKQKLILETLAPNNKYLRNKLLWDLAREHSGITNDNEIEKPFERSIQRAISKLEESKHIIIERRKLRDFDDLIENYPYKTKRLEICQLRKKIIPLLKVMLEKHDMPKFGLNAIEHRIIYNAKQSENYIAVEQEWRQLEELIFQNLSALNSGKRELLLSILIRGRELFTFADCVYKKPLGKLIEQCSEQESLSKNFLHILKKIKKFYSNIFPKSELNHGVFKSKLYSFVQADSRGQSVRIKKNIKFDLLRYHRELIQLLPGHQDSPTKSLGFERRTKFSPLLDEIFNKHVFSQFHFLSINR